VEPHRLHSATATPFIVRHLSAVWHSTCTHTHSTTVNQAPPCSWCFLITRPLFTGHPPHKDTRSWCRCDAECTHGTGLYTHGTRRGGSIVEGSRVGFRVGVAVLTSGHAWDVGKGRRLRTAVGCGVASSVAARWKQPQIPSGRSRWWRGDGYWAWWSLLI
jgi:hypothetical protein